jgi:hypothetical protein
VKKVISISAAVLVSITSISSAHGHAGVDTRGVTPTQGVSSVILLRIGHGCDAADGVTKIGTHSVSVVIPSALLPAPASAAMQIPGFKASVTPSTTLDTSGKPVSSTITWTSKSEAFDVDPVGFAEFGIRGRWATAGMHWLDTTQVCRLATKTPVAARIKTVTDPKTKEKMKVWVPATTKTTYQEYKLLWTTHDSAAPSVYSADKTTETGPAPTVTIAALAK